MKDGSAIDEEARLRTTSIYMTHEMLPMLPELLCERVCSLHPGADKLAFSVFFQIKKDGTLLEKSRN